MSLPTARSTVPPTIQALLAARLDQLDPAERVVLERGSIEGRVFHRGAVQALAPEDQQVMARLTTLVILIVGSLSSASFTAASIMAGLRALCNASSFMTSISFSSMSV